MLTTRMELIRYAHKTCLEFIVSEASSDHISDQPHSHSTIEITCIEKGRGAYAVSDQVYPFAPGDVFVFNSMERHNIRSIAQGDVLRTTAINFDPEYVAPMDSSDYDLQYLDAFFYTNRPCMLSADNPHAQRIVLLFRDMGREFDEKQNHYPLMVKSQLLAILSIFLRSFQTPEDEAEKLDYPIKRLDSIATVLSYIERNLPGDLSIDVLSNLVYMNRYYFSTFFKKYVGETPVQYITRKRVLMAMEMLDTTHMSILEIAIQSGFNNSSNFNRVFKQITGKSPSDYKKRKRSTDGHTDM